MLPQSSFARPNRKELIDAFLFFLVSLMIVMYRMKA
jgi:hypothetical protein